MQLPLITLINIWSRKGGDVHSKAIVTSCLGWLYLYQKDLNKAIKYLAQAAIYDNKGVVRETTALCTLARLLYKEVIYNMQLNTSDSHFRMQISMGHDRE